LNIRDTAGILVKKIKPDFKKLGPKYGKLMKAISEELKNWDRKLINEFEKAGQYTLMIDGQPVLIEPGDVEIQSDDLPGFHTASIGSLVVALDTSITPELREEGIVRELINRIQNLRKEKGFEVTDKISVELLFNNEINVAIQNNLVYLCSEILAQSFTVVQKIDSTDKESIELTDTISTEISIRRIEKQKTT
jgi:isoleucyl-tRNA synthetase